MQQLPTFKHHLDPLLSGVVVPSTNRCQCCGVPRGDVVDLPYYSHGDIEDICPLEMN